jgi:hypothetical protein
MTANVSRRARPAAKVIHGHLESIGTAARRTQNKSSSVKLPMFANRKPRNVPQTPNARRLKPN